jgi:hypothetical protein
VAPPVCTPRLLVSIVLLDAARRRRSRFAVVSPLVVSGVRGASGSSGGGVGAFGDDMHIVLPFTIIVNL